MLRIGYGYDLHRVTPNRDLVLAAVRIPWDAGLAGHSDADVVLHAVIDACLGALALGDIGQWFPDSDERWRGAASADLLRRVLADPRVSAWRVVNVDVTVQAEKPRLMPHIEAMREALSGVLGIDCGWVSIKATTMEGVGPVGRGEAIAAHAVVLLARPADGSH